MAEVASLVLGVAALVGTFKDCVDLFSYISASRSLGRDFELLDTKLDVEKTLLLQWAERVRLLDQTEYDKRLDQPAIGRTVSRVLVSVRLLLSESDSLQNRYGMTQVEKNDRPDVQSLVSGKRMERLNHKFEELNLRITNHQRQAPMLSKIRWAVHDKEKFDALIRELSHFISSLNNIMPDHTGSIPSMAEEDCGTHHGLRTLNIILKASNGLEDDISNAANRAITKICKKRILEQLWFRMIDDRRDHVKEAHFKTLHWALSRSEDDFERNSLADWLRCGSGTYWISGKAGSGKSTLMKYLWHHERTQKLLQEWSTRGNLTMASFFFWNLGTTEQKSLDGMWRGLLYQILKSNPWLIPVILPRMWQAARTSDNVPALPTSSEINTAFQSLGSSHVAEQYFCIFIDGLDEYSGNYLDAISFIDSLVMHPNVKTLVSSRPIPSCVQAFSCKPHLQLQDLTRGDIKRYVYHELESHIYMLRQADSVGTMRMLNDLVDKASGVFLWVVLACRSVREGLAAADSVSEIQLRVDELPPELEDLFQHMLNKIEPRYQEQAAKFLRVCYESQRSSTENHQRMPTAGLAIATGYDLDITKIPDVQEFPRSDLNLKCRILEGRLRSRCCGILEIALRSADTGVCFCRGDLHDDHDLLIDSTVEFIHRSVFEFLSGPEVWNLSCMQIADRLFEPRTILACMCLHQAQICYSNDCWIESGTYHLERSLYYALEADQSLPSSLLNYLSRVEAFLTRNFSGLHDTAPHSRQYSAVTNICSGIVFILAIEASLVNFIAAHSRSGAGSFAIEQKRYLLSHAVEQPLLRTRDVLLWRQNSSKMIQYLLLQGCDPNGTTSMCCPTIRSSSPWLHWLGELEALGSASAIANTARDFID